MCLASTGTLSKVQSVDQRVRWNAASAFANCGRAVAHVRASYGPSPCENAKTLDRDRTSYSFNAALAAQTASPFNFEIEPENIILVALRVFEFSHRLGQ